MVAKIVDVDSLISEQQWPRIHPLVENEMLSKLYVPIIQEALQRTAPTWFSSDWEFTLKELAGLRASLPLLKWSEYRTAPFELSFDLFMRQRQGASRFFFEMIGRWLVPGKQLKVTLCSSVDFTIPDVSSDIYTWSQIVVRIEEMDELQVLRRNLPVLESEVRLGVLSSYHSKRILEIKGLRADEKTVMVQENIAHIVRRRGRRFGEEIFRDLQHFLINCGDPFKLTHSARQMSRIVCAHYYLRKVLRIQVEQKPRGRHLILKLMRLHRSGDQGLQHRLGMFVSVNFLRPNEVFESRHLLRGISPYLPGASMCEGTVLINPPRGDSILTLYLEIEKSDKSPFTAEEIKRLYRGLPSDLKGRIEQPMHSVFLPQNEEEIMRHILALSRQLRYPRDLPQVVILFREQTDVDVIFTVILVRVFRSGDPALLELLQKTFPQGRFSFDLVRVVGSVRNRYVKEANVFRVSLKKEVFLRGDHCLDLFQARQTVRDAVHRSVGEFRDFNGGMIAKQDEVLTAVRKSLGLLANRRDWLLEDFFHGISPVVMRSVIQPQALEKLFLMLSAALDEREYERVGTHVKLQEDNAYVYALMVGADGAFRDRVLRAVESLDLPPMRLATTMVKVAEAYVLGVLYGSDDMLERLRVLDAIEESVVGLNPVQRDLAESLAWDESLES